jgi:hypothetical protein
MALSFPGGVKVDKNDNLLMIDQLAVTVSTYAPPYTSPPTNVLTLTGDPISFAHTSNEQAIWDANAVNLDGEEYSYLNNPSGPPGTLLDTTSTSGLATPIDAGCDPLDSRKTSAGRGTTLARGERGTDANAHG